jgi:hypothetical protein
MKLSEKQFLFSKNVAKLIFFIYDKGFMCTHGEAFRTHEQAEIYAAQGIGIINSRHGLRLAIDLNIFSPEGQYLTATESYQQFGKYWESLNPANKWGGNFQLPTPPDGNHFEMEP